MLGSKPLESVLGVHVDNTDHEAVRAFVRQAADIGLSLLFIYPGSKMPADMRTPAKRRADDKAAQEAAREAGRKDWAIVKSPAGLALATSDKTTLDRYLKRYIEMFSTWVEVLPDGTAGKEAPYSKKALDAGQLAMAKPAAVNLAVEVGGSGVVVIDCDTAAQTDRWFEAAEIAPEDRPAPTIITPGHVGTEGDPNDPTSWAHADGGHFWFTVPDRFMPVLPRHLGAMTWGGDNGFAVLWDRRYVLIPPSTRPEGKYEQLGHVYELPDWLAEEIIKAGERRVHRAASHDHEGGNTDLATAVDTWAESVSWQSILEPLGWTPAPRADSCGCPVWTAPGVHASPKSATAHDTGCAAGRYTEVNAPLHIWTDNPAEPFDKWIEDKGTSTISKLQAVALINYGGNIGKAMTEMGVTPDLSVNIDPTLDPKGIDQDLDTTGDGSFELPEADPEPLTGEELFNLSQDGSTPVCVVCKTADGLFVEDEDGQLWHAADEDDAAETGGHLADPRLAWGNLPTQIEVVITDGPDPNAPTPDPNLVIAAPVTDTIATAEDMATWQANGSLDALLSAGLPPTPYADAVEAPDPDVFDSKHTGVPRIAPFSHWRGMPPPEYIIDGLIEHGGLSCLIGPPGVGKSTVALDMACHIATGKRWQGRSTLKTRVLYLPGEGLSGAIQRISAWEDAHQVDMSDLILGNGIIQVAAQNEAWGEIAGYIARQGIGLVIFDTFARMSSGLEENSATDVGKAVKRFDKLRELTNTGVCVVHHTAKGAPDVARGSSALNGALDSELLVRPATWDTADLRDDQGRYKIEGCGPIEVWTTKQKNAEQLENPIPLLLTSYWLPDAPRSTALITGPGGKIDPMQGEIVMARPLAEPIVETAIRVREFIDMLPTQGATRAEIVVAVKPDAYARSRKDTPVYWKQRIAEAVDRGLRYQLIETLTGTPAGARYIPSVADADTARGRAAAEVINDDE